MTENLKKFLEAVSHREDLSAKVGAMDEEALLALARELDIALTADDFKTPSMQELDDDELDMIAGGESVNCSCAVGGGGSGDNNDKTCACVGAGAGLTKENDERCVCVLGGFGYEY